MGIGGEGLGPPGHQRNYHQDLDLTGQDTEAGLAQRLDILPEQDGHFVWHWASQWTDISTLIAVLSIIFYFSKLACGNLALTESWIMTLPSEFLWFGDLDWPGVRTSPHVLVLLMSLIIAIVTSVIATCKYWQYIPMWTMYWHVLWCVLWSVLMVCIEYIPACIQC